MPKRKLWLVISGAPRIYFALSRIFFVFLVVIGLSAHATPPPTDQEPGSLADLPLEALMEIEVPTVFAASKFEQKVSAAPSSITMVTSEDIKRYGHRTIADILQSMQGF